MFRFPLTQRPQISREPFSLQTLDKATRLRGATVTESVCPYCAVGLRPAHLHQERPAHRHRGRS